MYVSITLTGSLLPWVYLALIFIFFSISLVRRPALGAMEVRGPRADLLLFLIVNLAFILLPLIFAISSFFDGLDNDLPPYLNVVGVAGLVGAVIIRFQAHRDLGDSFTISPGASRRRELVITGIYAHVRHPMYLSMLVWAMAAPLVLENLLVGFAPLASIIAFLAVRLPIEEEMLLGEFGDRYRAYMGTTGGILPRLGPRSH